MVHGPQKCIAWLFTYKTFLFFLFNKNVAIETPQIAYAIYSHCRQPNTFKALSCWEVVLKRDSSKNGKRKITYDLSSQTWILEPMVNILEDIFHNKINGWKSENSLSHMNNASGHTWTNPFFLFTRCLPSPLDNENCILNLYITFRRNGMDILKQFMYLSSFLTFLLPMLFHCIELTNI